MSNDDRLTIRWGLKIISVSRADWAAEVERIRAAQPGPIEGFEPTKVYCGTHWRRSDTLSGPHSDQYGAVFSTYDAAEAHTTGVHVKFLVDVLASAQRNGLKTIVCFDSALREVWRIDIEKSKSVDSSP